MKRSPRALYRYPILNPRVFSLDMRLACYNACSRHVTHRTVGPCVGLLKHARSFTASITISQKFDDSVPPDFDYKSFFSDIFPPPNPNAKHIAILGGGLSGLATAFHVSRQLPKAKITIFEKSDKIGGWVNSEVVKVDDGEVLFEWGPRTIRCGTDHAPTSMLAMVCISAHHA